LSSVIYRNSENDLDEGKILILILDIEVHGRLTVGFRVSTDVGKPSVEWLRSRCQDRAAKSVLSEATSLARVLLHANLPRTDNMPDPTIIRAAVPRSLCETALAELKKTVAVGEQVAYAKYELTQTCVDIGLRANEVG
jgi:hypothetical protein